MAKDRDSMQQRLPQSGRCHDWAAVTLYSISYDKFLTLSCLSWLRWLTWISFGVGILIHVFVPMAPREIGGYTLEALMLGTTVFDLGNLREKDLKQNRVKTSQLRGPFWYDFTKFVCTAILLGVYFYSGMSRWTRSFEFYAFVFFSFLSAQIVTHVLSSVDLVVPSGELLDDSEIDDSEI